jgi:serine/threonine protein phosphatase 1
LPQSHRQLLASLRPWVVHGDYLFVHAGIRPGLPLAAQREEDLLWMRDPFLGWPDRHEKMVVHGHSVRPAPQLLHNRIGIDTGAYATGILTAVALEDSTVRIIQARRER